MKAEYYELARQATAHALDALIVLEVQGGETTEARGYLRQAVKSAENARKLVMGANDGNSR